MYKVSSVRGPTTNRRIHEFPIFTQVRMLISTSLHLVNLFHHVRALRQASNTDANINSPPELALMLMFANTPPWPFPSDGMPFWRLISQKIKKAPVRLPDSMMPSRSRAHTFADRRPVCPLGSTRSPPARATSSPAETGLEHTGGSESPTVGWSGMGSKSKRIIYREALQRQQVSRLQQPCARPQPPFELLR